MAGKISGAVWDLLIPHNEAWVLLAMADHSDHEGRNVRPSIELLCYKTGWSERQVQLVISELRRKSILVPTARSSRGNPTEYWIDLSKAPRKPPFKRGEQRIRLPRPQRKGVQTSAPKPRMAMGEHGSPLIGGGVGVMGAHGSGEAISGLGAHGAPITPTPELAMGEHASGEARNGLGCTPAAITGAKLQTGKVLIHEPFMNRQEEESGSPSPNALAGGSPPPPETEEEFLSNLASEFPHVDVPKLLGKMNRWCRRNREVPTRERLRIWCRTEGRAIAAAGPEKAAPARRATWQGDPELLVQVKALAAARISDDSAESWLDAITAASRADSQGWLQLAIVDEGSEIWIRENYSDAFQSVLMELGLEEIRWQVRQ